MLVLAFSVSAFAASNEPPLPKPDLPPKSAPHPAPAPAPAVPEPVAPAAAPAPVVTPIRPTTQARPSDARRRAAAARRAKARTARLARAAHRAAERRAAVAAAHRRERAQTVLRTPAAAGPSTPWAALVFLIAAFSAALVLLGLALTPAWAIPWRRASLLLEDRRDELGVIGAMSLAATMLFFLLVQVTS